MPFDIDSARKAGYKDNEIADFLSQQHSNFDVQGAMKAGYSVDDIASKLNKPNRLPNDVINEPGLQSVPTLITKPDLEQAGESAATNMAKKGVNPYVAAGVGTGIAKLDDIAAAVAGVRGAPEAAEALTSVGKGLKTVASEGISKLQSLADAIMGPGEKSATLTAEQMTSPARQVVQDTATALKGAPNPTPDLLATQQRQAGLGLKYDQKVAQLTDMKKTAGQAIGDVEKANGLGFNELPDNFQTILRDKDLLAKKANSMARLADKGADFVSQNLDPQTIQVNRKLAQTALKASGTDDLTRVQLAKANSVFGQALGNSIPELSDKLSAFKDIDQALKVLPKDKKTEADALRVSIQRITAGIRTNKMALQDKMQMANEALDSVSKDAETLIQRGTQRDLNRDVIKKIGIGAAVAAGVPTVLTKFGGK